MTPNLPRILIVKLGAIGDVVVALPAANALHRAGYAIDWVCGTSVAPLLRCFPWIRILPVDDRAIFTGSAATRGKALFSIWRQLFGVRYALCATLYYDARYLLVPLPVRAERRLRLSTTDRDRLVIQGRNRRDEFARLMLGAVGLWKDTATEGFLAHPRIVDLPEPPIARTPGMPRVLLCPGGAKNLLRDDPVRRWPLDRYASLAQRLADRGIEVILIGGPDDHWVVSAFDSATVVNAVGRCTLVETLSLMEHSDVVVTHDTGPMHLAGLTGASMLALFGPTDPRAFSPQRTGCDALWGGEGLSCRPCYDGFRFAPCESNLCMQSITVDAVNEGVTVLLGDRRSNNRRLPRVIAH